MFYQLRATDALSLHIQGAALEKYDQKLCDNNLRINYEHVNYVSGLVMHNILKLCEEKYTPLQVILNVKDENFEEKKIILGRKFLNIVPYFE